MKGQSNNLKPNTREYRKKLSESTDNCNTNDNESSMSATSQRGEFVSAAHPQTALTYLYSSVKNALKGK